MFNIVIIGLSKANKKKNKKKKKIKKKKKKKPPNPHANIHPSYWNIDGKTKATGWGKKTGSINLSENKGSVSLGRGFSSSLMAPFLHPYFFLTFIFYANKVSMNMNMIELRSPSLSKIQQKPDHPVWWFTIVTFCKYMPLTFKLSNTWIKFTE